MSVELELQFEQLSDEFDAWGNILTSLSLNRKKLSDERIRLRTLGLVSLSMSNVSRKLARFAHLKHRGKELLSAEQRFRRKHPRLWKRKKLTFQERRAHKYDLPLI